MDRHLCGPGGQEEPDINPYNHKKVSDVYGCTMSDEKASPYAFRCPVCGSFGLIALADVHRELNVCTGCGSNSRFRATVLSLMHAFYGPIPVYNLNKIEPQKSLRGIGISDSSSYAKILGEKFDYVNTHFHCEPHLDIEDSLSYAPYKPIDFILCSDVIEHTLLPPSEVIPKIYDALQPGGILILCAPTYELDAHIEKYPTLENFTVESTGEGFKVVYTSKLGILGEDANPFFHGGPGRVLELRLISNSGLLANLISVGFEVSIIDTVLQKKYGAWWPEQRERNDITSLSIGYPFICKKTTTFS